MPGAPAPRGVESVFKIPERSEVEILYKILFGVVSLAAGIIAVGRFMASSPTGFFWALMLLCILLLVGLWYVVSQVRYIGYLKKDPSRLVHTAAELLRGCSESLYYYGGVGLINHPDVHDWQNAFDEKLADKNFKIVRIIDLQSLADLQTVYRLSPDRFNRAIQQYSKWIGVHKNRFKDRDSNVRASNSIYTFPGAPIWQYGFHVIVFDERHMLIVYRKDQHARGLLLRNRPAVCRDAVAMIENLREHLLMKEITGQDLDRLHAELLQIHERQRHPPERGRSPLPRSPLIRDRAKEPSPVMRARYAGCFHASTPPPAGCSSDHTRSSSGRRFIDVAPEIAITPRRGSTSSSLDSARTASGTASGSSRSILLRTISSGLLTSSAEYRVSSWRTVR